MIDGRHLKKKPFSLLLSSNQAISVKICTQMRILDTAMVRPPYWKSFCTRKQNH